MSDKLLENKLWKRGSWDVPVWLVWSLVALVAFLFILWLVSGKASGLLQVVGSLFAPG